MHQKLKFFDSQTSGPGTCHITLPLPLLSPPRNRVNMEECSPSHAIPDFAPIGDFQVLEELQIKYAPHKLYNTLSTISLNMSSVV